MFNSLRYRLLFWYLGFIIITVLTVIPFTIFHNRQEKKAAEFVQQLNTLHVNLLKDLSLSGNFISNETINPDFFLSGESKYLDEHEKYITQIESSINFINNNEITKSSDITGSLEQLTNHFNSYNQIFDSIIYFTYKKGYKDYGLEGELESYAQQIENYRGIDTDLFRKIRQNEKEYITRKDSVYVKNFNSASNLFRSKLIKSKPVISDKKLKLLTLFKNYQRSFNELVKIDNLLGNEGNSGLKNALSQKSDLIESQLYKLIESSKSFQHTYTQKTNILYGLIVFFLLLITTLSVFLISKHIVSHLEGLTQYISNFTKSKFKYHGNINLKNSTREIAQVHKEFHDMAGQLIIWEKQRDKALDNTKESEQRYRELAEMLPQSIFETDRWGNFTYVNRTWYKNFGYSEKDLEKGLNIIETVVTATGSNISDHWMLENSNFFAIRKNGSRFPASIYSNNIVKGGEIRGRRGIIIDVTERNQYIETLKQEHSDALASNQHKSFFLANMSHEIRTPMNSIIGFSNLLASDAISEDQKKEFINYIQSSGELLLNLIDDIIDISKIEAGEIKINKKECHLNQVLEELRITFEDHKNKTAKSHLDLKLNMAENSDLIIKTDPLRLRQILVNLISNAIKFTDEGFVEFGYNTHNDRLLEFYVKDTGIGLSRNELNIIFERFKRTRITEQRDISGTGLGLAISKNLVKLLGGDMWVDSVIEEGTTFYFTLPLLRVKNIDEKSHTQEDVPEEYHWNNKTILIAEDDENSYMFIKEILRKTGVHIIRSENGKQVTDMVQKYEEVDLILMDVLLPEVDGYEATRNVKKLFPDLPVIAQTAFAMDGDKEKSILAGCDDYITKPLNANNLLAKINQFIHRRHPQQQYEKPAVKKEDESVAATLDKKVWKDQMN